MRVLLLTAVLVGLTAPPRLAMRVDPAVVLEGGDLAVTCRVSPHPDNQSVTATITHYRSSTDPLNGEQAAIEHRFEFHHIPCEANAAECALVSAGADFFAVKSIIVGGCDER